MEASGSGAGSAISNDTNRAAVAHRALGWVVRTLPGLLEGQVRHPNPVVMSARAKRATRQARSASSPSQGTGQRPVPARGRCAEPN